VGLAGRVEFLAQEPDVEDGKRGCFRAHQAAARKALERGARRALTFEDDVQFLTQTSVGASRAAHFLSAVVEKEDPQWEIFFLGHFPQKMEPTLQPDVVRVRSMDGHAYILSERGMRALASLEYRGDQVDVHYHYACEHAYALYPMVAVQAALFSDTERVQRADDWNDDKLRRESTLYEGCVRRQMLLAAMSAGAGGAGGASCAASREASSAALGDVLLSSRPSGSEGDAIVGKATVGAEASREAVDPPTKSPARRVHPATEMAVERRQRHSSADYFPTIRVTRRERHKSHEW